MNIRIVFPFRFSKVLLAALLVVVLFALAAPALAQDVSPVPVSPASFVERLLTLLSDATYIPAAAAGVVVFTSAISLILFKLGIELSGGTRMLLALAVQVVVWVAYTLLTRAGFEAQFEQWYASIVTIVQALLPLAGSVFLAHRWYEGAKVSGTPVLGFSPKLVPGSNAYRKARAQTALKDD